jgi:hypothetical protein
METAAVAAAGWQQQQNCSCSRIAATAEAAAAAPPPPTWLNEHMAMGHRDPGCEVSAGRARCKTTLEHNSAADAFIESGIHCKPDPCRHTQHQQRTSTCCSPCSSFARNILAHRFSCRFRPWFAPGMPRAIVISFTRSEARCGFRSAYCFSVIAVMRRTRSSARFAGGADVCQPCRTRLAGCHRTFILSMPAAVYSSWCFVHAGELVRC